MSERNASKGCTDWAILIRSSRSAEVWARVMKGSSGHMRNLPTRPEVFEMLTLFKVGSES